MRVHKSINRRSQTENKNLTSNILKIIFNVKQLKMNKFMKYIWQLIISIPNATPEVPSLRPCYLFFT